MQRTIKYRFLKIPRGTKEPELWIGFIVLVIGLTVFQDFLFSKVHTTGFYISESLLYSSIWFFLAPLGILQIRILKRLKFNSVWKNIGTTVALSTIITLIHIFVFASFFVMVSYFVFSPTHYFSNIISSAASNQFYIIFLFYTLLPFVVHYLHGTNQKEQSPTFLNESIRLKIGLKTITLKTEDIETISTEKPYTTFTSNGKRYLDNRTLKDLKTILNPKIFVQVHRSTIVNGHFIKELESRKNGDYDALLKSGQVIRFSRHYRGNWQSLLH